MRTARVGFIVVSLFLVFATLVPQAWAAESRIFTVRFAETGLRAEHEYLAGQDYDLVMMDDLGLATQPGSPCLPVSVVYVYVPRGKEIAGLRVESVEQTQLAGRYMLLPGQHEVPYSSDAVPDPVAPDPVIYAMNAPYPTSPVEACPTGSMGGRKMAAMKVSPVQYLPAEGTLTLNREITFSVEFGDARTEPVRPLETEAVCRLRNRIVASMVENSGDVEMDFPPGGATLDPADATEYLMLCHENHVDEYQALKDWKTRKGVPAKIVTVQDASAAYPGRDDAEKLRNCIRDYYQNHSTIWVLLTLSAPKATFRGCYCDVSGTVDHGIPCDLYFADMDGDWNSDGDSYWGEVNDDVDLYPDVYVGRAPANTGLQVLPIVDKILTYEGRYELPTDYQHDMLFLAEYADPETDGGVGKNLIDTESVPSRFDPITKLYESSGNLSHYAAMNALNSGKAFINHDGHGNASLISIGSSVLNTDDMLSLTNAPRYSILYTVACIPGNFGNPVGCLGRGFLESENGGGFFIGNSRYGWYWPGHPGYGTGELYDRQFFKSLFVREMDHLGVVHADAKVQRIPYSGSNNTDRWTQFTSNLFGDPETPVWIDTPLELAASHPDSILPGNHMMGVTVSAGGSPLTGARVCLWMGDDIYMVEETGDGGTAQFTFSVVDTGDILVTVTKDAYLPYLGEIHVGGDVSGIADGGRVERPMVRISPNPVTGQATIDFTLPGHAAVPAGTRAVVGIYDASGRLVGKVSAKPGEPAGSLRWDGSQGGAQAVPPGIYFARLTCGHETAVTKFVVLE